MHYCDHQEFGLAVPKEHGIRKPAQQNPAYVTMDEAEELRPVVNQS